MEQNNRIQYLLERLAARTATPAELDELAGLVDADSAGTAMHQVETWLQTQQASNIPFYDNQRWMAVADRILQADKLQAGERQVAEIQVGERQTGQLQAAEIRTGQLRADELQAADMAPTGSVQEEKVPRIRFLHRWGWAAAAILLAAAGTLLFRYQHRPESAITIAAGKTQHIEPGRNGAVLTLADGSQIVLDSLSDGIIAHQNGSNVTLRDNTLLYTGDGNIKGSDDGDTKSSGSDDARRSGNDDAKSSGNGDARGPADRANLAGSNIVTTPKGRQFHLVLPDGSKVWMNAGSILQFPVSFSRKERKVQLTGEAYFEVAKDAVRPFKVDVPALMNLEVLGTSFNINAYPNERGCNTTLISGAVRVSSANNSGGRMVSLRPGQQVLATNSSLGPAKDANVEKVIAWKNGLFNFEGAGLREMMRQLERWYNLEVVYEGNVPDVQFFGEMSRSLELSDVLAGLERSNVHFRLEEGRRLVVMP